MNTASDQHPPVVEDALNGLQNDSAAILKHGMTFTLRRRSIFRHFGKPERTFLIQEAYLGTLYFLSKEWAKVDVSTEGLENDFLAEGKRLVAENVFRHARIVAIAYLNSGWKIQLFGGFVAHYFSRRIKPQKLLKLSLIINETSNLIDFIRACQMMSANPRTTQPIRTETTTTEEEYTLNEYTHG